MKQKFDFFLVYLMWIDVCIIYCLSLVEDHIFIVLLLSVCYFLLSFYYASKFDVDDYDETAALLFTPIAWLMFSCTIFSLILTRNLVLAAADILIAAAARKFGGVLDEL